MIIIFFHFSMALMQRKTWSTVEMTDILLSYHDTFIN